MEEGGGEEEVGGVWEARTSDMEEGLGGGRLTSQKPEERKKRKEKKGFQKKNNLQDGSVEKDNKNSKAQKSGLAHRISERANSSSLKGNGGGKKEGRLTKKDGLEDEKGA